MSFKLLLDANLSWRLVPMLKNDFPEILYINKTGLQEAAKDTQIWEWSKKHNYTIITNDEDFILLCMGKGFPPKIILLRTGNQSTKYIAQILLKHKEEIALFISNKTYGILEIY